jgi:cell division septation protein DedD
VQSTAVAPEILPVEKPAAETGISYRIQVFATTVKSSNLREKYMSKGIFDPIQEDFDGKTYRYTIGNFETQTKALEYLKELRSKGLTDAFVVKYADGVRQKP